ncbi:MFS transporter [Nesterenkonia marinintestina]|uniref:MFS transporter n=1 Tax=Nesterenkonia marinintestina TaxID=2979865 RepID=UPI0021BFD620|nr:MFS transporter [Nesterenkonia sp. GX14115]
MTDTGTLSAQAARHLTVSGACLIAVCYGLARFAYGLFLPGMREEFALSSGAAGVIAAASYSAYCAGIAASGALTPRLGARTVAVSAGVLATVGCALIAAAPSTAALGVGVAVAGSSTGVASPPLAHAVALHIDPSRRDRAQTIVNAGTGIGVMVSGPVALLAQDHWRIGWLAFTLAAAVVAVWVWRTVPPRPPHRPKKASQTTRPAPSALFPRGSLSLVTAAVLMGAASAAGWTFGQDFLQTEGGHDRTLATAAWICLGASGLFGAVAGDLIRAVSLRSAWTALMLAFAATTAVWALWPQSPAVAVLASAAFGALYVALTGVLLVWGTRLHTRRPSTGVGIAFLAIALGQAAATPAIGAVADLSSMSEAFLVAAGVALTGSLIRGARRTVSEVSA